MSIMFTSRKAVCEDSGECKFVTLTVVAKTVKTLPSGKELEFG